LKEQRMRWIDDIYPDFFFHSAATKLVYYIS
jgi:hypothetical protein